MLDIMTDMSFINRVVLEGPWKYLQVMNNIHTLARRDIDAGKAFPFILSAGDIELQDFGHFFRRCICRHICLSYQTMSFTTS